MRSDPPPKDWDCLPRIETILDSHTDVERQKLFLEGIKLTLKELLPPLLAESKANAERTQEGYKKKLLAILPLVSMKVFTDKPPFEISFYTVYRFHAHAFKFFFNLITSWLIPGKVLNISFLSAVDFRMPELNEKLYTLCEIVLKVESKELLDQILSNFHLIESEARLGIESEYYARKILEVKGLSADQKTTLMQRRVADLVKKRADLFTKDLFHEMQHFMIVSHTDFKEQRSIHHISKIITRLSLFRRELLEKMKEAPHERHVLVKAFTAYVQFPLKKRQILGLVVGLNFFKEKEVFEQRHLLRAIERCFPHVKVIDQTFTSDRKGSEMFKTAYVEIEKNNGEPFSVQEVKALNHFMKSDLHHHVGQLLLPVFMPRNDEEIMRNIVALSQQIKYLRDLPQVFITFDEQTDRNLFFTVIFVRTLHADDKSIQEKIRASGSFLRYIHDRTRHVGMVRNKYPKEATVFRLKFSKDSFIRGDHSIDLYKARQALVDELTRLMGEFRDYNGGMISKQGELLKVLKQELHSKGIKFQELLLENFFNSLTPVIIRTVLDLEAFSSFFLLQLEALEKKIPKDALGAAHAVYGPEVMYVIFKARQRSDLEDTVRGLGKLQATGVEMMQSYVKAGGYIYIGYIFKSADPFMQEQIQAIVVPWQSGSELHNLVLT